MIRVKRTRDAISQREAPRSEANEPYDQNWTKHLEQAPKPKDKDDKMKHAQVVSRLHESPRCHKGHMQSRSKTWQHPCLVS